MSATMERRDVLALIAGAAAPALWPLAARAQQAGKIPRIGYLAPGSPTAGLVARDRAFQQGLRELGYIDGKNVLIEYRYAEGHFDRLPALAAELVALKVDVIVAAVTQASLAAKRATTTIPIVMVGVSDPLASGLVTSLARPEGNITGTSSQTAEVLGKSMQILKEAVPALARVAMLWNPGNAVFQAQMLKEAEAAARTLGLETAEFGARDASEIERAFAAMTSAAPGALLVLADPILAQEQKRIVDFANRNRLPAMYGIKDYAAAGGLMAYAANVEDQYRRAAAHVDKILKGARPGDLPVEQPVKFEFAINLKTARAIGLDIPTTILLRADEVIE